MADPFKANDTRWAQRSHFDWENAEKHHQGGTVEQKLFNALKKLISLRKELFAQGSGGRQFQYGTTASGFVDTEFIGDVSTR